MADDYIRLSSQLTLSGEVLHDTVTGARHRVYAPGRPALMALEQGTLAKTWVDSIATQVLRPSDTTQLIASLNRVGAITTQRRPVDRLIAVTSRVAHRLAGVHLPSPVWRRPATLRHIIVAATKAIMPVAAALSAVCLPAYGANVPVRFLLTVVPAGLGVLWAGIVAHEFAHALVLSRYNQPAAVIQHGLHVGILHSALPPTREFVVAAIGPYAGAAASLGLGGGVGFALHNPYIWCLGGLLMLAHLANLLPGQPDGKYLWRKSGEAAA